MSFQQINNCSCFIEIWIAFFCGLGFQGNVIIDGKNNYYELQNEMYKISFNAWIY